MNTKKPKSDEQNEPPSTVTNREQQQYQKESIALLKLLRMSENSLKEQPLTLDEAFN